MAKIYLSSGGNFGKVLESRLPIDKNFIWINGVDIPIEDVKDGISNVEKNINKYLCIKQKQDKIEWLNNENKISFFNDDSRIFCLSFKSYDSNKKNMEDYYNGYDVILKVIITMESSANLVSTSGIVVASFYFDKGLPKTSYGRIFELNNAINSFEKSHSKGKVKSLKKKIASSMISEINLDIFQVNPDGPTNPPYPENGGGAGTGGIASGVRVPKDQ